MIGEKIRIDYIVRPEKLESPGMIQYVHFAEPIVCVDGEDIRIDVKRMTVEVVKDGDD